MPLLLGSGRDAGIFVSGRSRADLISVNGAGEFVTSMLVERDAANADKAVSKNDLLLAHTTNGEDP
jgi:hypothetical protein